MINLAMLVLLLAAPPAASPEGTAMPRHPDPELAERQEQRTGTPTDPWFDREHVATDDPAFVLAAIESARQGVVDARNAASELGSAELRVAAEKIHEQNAATTRKLEQLAGAKGWRLPQPNPVRTSTFEGGGVHQSASVRTNANFIVNQISYHENTLAQYRAQIAGKGDADLKRVLRQAVPGFQKNLELLLTLKP
jgi:predicted outer membrane protein